MQATKPQAPLIRVFTIANCISAVKYCSMPKYTRQKRISDCFFWI